MLGRVSLDQEWADRAEYRSAIFYHTPEQLETAKAVTAEVQDK